MSLFEIEGWSVSVPVQSSDSLQLNAPTTAAGSDTPIPKKHRKKIKKAQTHAIEDKYTRSESGKKVTSDELQKLFVEQFGVNGEMVKDEKSKKEIKKSTLTASSDTKSDSVVESSKLKRKAEDENIKSPKREKEKKSEAIHQVVPKLSKDKNPRQDDKKASTFNKSEVATVIAKPIQQVKLTPLQQKMKDKLAGSRFRWINEKLYTTTSEDAIKLIKKQPELYKEYHEGFRQQVQSWPENPVDIFVTRIKEMAKSRMPPPKGLPKDRDGTTYIADMGCGDAELSRQVSTKYAPQKKNGKRAGRFDPKIVVHSFDLAKTNERVTVADVKRVPLPDASVHIVVFCLCEYLSLEG